MKWVKVAIGAVIAIISMGIIATSTYDLTQPKDSVFYNDYTLREVFENRNRAMPNLSRSTDLGGGNYRLYDNNDITIDYNINSGIWTVNGQPNTSTTVTLFNFISGLEYTITYTYISGDISGQFTILTQSPNATYIDITALDYENQRTETFIPTTQTLFRIYSQSSNIFNNFQFKIQLEKGDTVTPYQVPTNRPYSNIDVGQFDLTPEQIQTYYDLYLELEPAVLTGITATLILLTPLVFAGGVLAYLLNKQNY